MPASKRGTARTPRGWKVLREEPYCPTCKHTAHTLRALIVPVAGPVTQSWDELRAELKTMWAETTRCANWLVSELYARDVRRQPGDDRLPPMPHIYLYPEARALFPRLPAQSVAALLQAVLRRYRAARYSVVWMQAASLASYRYPVGLTLPSQAWSLHEEEGRWIVSVRLSDSRWRLRLRGGAPMRRQIEKLQRLNTGEAERGSLTIYESPSPGTTHRGGSSVEGSRLMVKIAAWWPKAPSADRSATVRVWTDERSMLNAEPRWRIDPAPVRGVLAAESRRRASLLTNLQSIRMSRGSTDGIERHLRDLSRRTHQRIVESCRTYAAHLAAHVVARGAREVHYDDRVRPDLSHFPWELLRRRIAEKLDERGIRFLHVSGQGEAQTRDQGRDGEHAA